MTGDGRISFREIPGHSRLFLDYLDWVPPARAFFRHRPGFAELLDYSRDTAAGAAADRQALAGILRLQNRQLESGPAALGHIDDLASEGSVAVITGQQAGLFTGPLYTIYKALGALKLARMLRANGIRAVPVFWIECEDHDLKEVTKVALLDRAGTICEYQFAELLYPDSAGVPISVGTRTLPPAIENVRTLLRETMAGSPNQEEADRLIGSFYREGEGIAGAFGRSLARLFLDDGLVLFNSQAPEAKPLLQPLFERCISESEDIRAALERRSSELQSAGYHSQVGILEHSTLLFFQEDGRRRALVREGNGFRPKNSSRAFSLDELLALARKEPALFSPNVLLRPLAQDFLFPTAAYIAGPGEIAYFAQAECLYSRLDRPMPLIWPRPSFTLIEANWRREMEAGGVRLEDCFAGRNSLLARMLPGGEAASRRIEWLGEQIHLTLEEMRPQLRAVDRSLETAADTARRKMLFHIGRIQRRLRQTEEKRNESLVRRTDRILAPIFPHQILQERVFGGYQFLTRQGASLLRTLERKTSPEAFLHTVAELE